jgi:hypothetical protein
MTESGHQRKGDNTSLNWAGDSPHEQQTPSVAGYEKAEMDNLVGDQAGINLQ